MSKTRKGQVFSTDFTASILIFGIILSSFLLIWNIALSAPIDTAQLELKTQTQQTSDTLIKTPGKNTSGGTNWDPNQPSQIQYPGLKSTENTTHVLSTTKISQLNQTGAKNIANKYDLPNLYIEIDIDNGATTYQIGNQNQMQNADIVVPVKREATTKDGKPVELKIRSYENQ